MKSRCFLTAVLIWGLAIFLAGDSSAWNHPCFHFSDELAGEGLSSEVTCIVEFQGTWYIGGHFLTIDGQPAGGVARWNGSHWEPLPSILTDSENYLRVHAMCTMDDGEGEQLYVGGEFDGAGGLQVSNIARWDGSAWSQLEYGLDGPVLALTAGYFDPDGVIAPFVMAGGDFDNYLVYISEDNWYPEPSANFTVWYQNRWNPPYANPGKGLNGPVRALYTLEEDSPLGRGVCIGGDFTATEDNSSTDLNHFAIFRHSVDYESPAAAENFGPTPKINAFTVHPYNEYTRALFFGGQFNMPGGNECNLAIWFGNGFEYTAGFDGPVYDLGSCDTYYHDSPALYVGGNFSQIDPASGDPRPASNLAYWVNDDLNPLCPGNRYALDCTEQGVADFVSALYPLAQGGTLFNSIMIGGNFVSAGGQPHNRLTLWEEAEFVTIVASPQDALVCEGNPVTFSAQASGSELNYQWQYRPDDQSIWSPIDGAVGTSFSIANTTQEDNGLYQCEVTGVCSVEYSGEAELTVGYAPVITTQPYLNADPCIGETMYIKAVFDAVPDATWQWYHDDDPIVTSDIYCQVFIEDADWSDEGVYRVEITNQCDTAHSESYELTLTEGPTITQHPQSATVREGDPHTFNAAASGTSPALQWRFGGVDIDGENSDSYTIHAVQESHEGDYDMVATNLCDTDVSNTATLTVEPNQPPTAVATADPTSGYLEPLVGLVVYFDGSGSTDPEGLDLDYFWDFGDGGTSTEISPVHPYTEGGIFDAILTVTDDLGASHSDTVQITALDCLVEPTHLEFALVLVGEMAYETFSVTNLSAAPISIEVTAACEGFEVFDGGGLVELQPGGSAHEVTIRFSPTDVVHYDCVVDIGYDLAPEVTCHGKGVHALVDYENSLAMIYYPLEVSMPTLPDGSGDRLDNCFDQDGNRVDATIVLTLIDTLGDPVEGYPLSDIWLESTEGSLNSCCNMLSHPDGPTDLSGETTFTGPLFTGGHSQPDEMIQVVIDGIPLASSAGFDVRFNSPDMNRDCLVNLADVTLFAQVFFSEYDYSADFFWDGQLNLLDIVFLTQGYGAGCRGAKAIPEPAGDGGSLVSLALFADTHGTATSLTAAPGDPFNIYLVLQGDREGLLGWECRAVPSPNLRILGWELAGQAVNISTAPEFNVGLGEALKADGVTLLASARCQVTDGQPASLALAPAAASSFEPAAPALILGSHFDHSRLSTAGMAEPFMINVENVSEILPQQPDRTALLPAAPNPFNPQTLIRFQLPATDRVQLVVYSIDGRQVRTLVDEVRGVGHHEVIWNGRDDHGRTMASGTYFYRLKTRGFQETRRMVLIK